MSKIFAVLLLSFLNGAVRGESPATPVELPVLPSSYGYYALDQGGLTPLFERTLGNTKEEKQARQHFSSDVSVVVFQKWLSEPNASLNTIDVFDWRTMDDEPRPKVPRQISPVKGHPDMAVVSMPGGFKPGIYSVNHDKREYAIGVGLDNLEGWWKDVLKENPKRWHAHEYLGAFCFMRSDLDGALEYWKHCVELKPDLYETHNNYALALSAKGRKDDALKEYEIAVKLDGHQLAVRINYADALRGAKRFDEAIEQYREAARLSPDNAAVFLNLGVTYFQKNELDLAIGSFKEALRIKPDYMDAKNNLRTAESRKEQQQKEGRQSENPAGN